MITAVGVAVLVGLSLGACRASGSSSNDTVAPVSTTTPVSTAVGAGVAGTNPNAAWCAKLAGLPDALGSLTTLQGSQFDRLQAPFAELRDLAPAEAKADVQLLLDLVTKASQDAKAGTLGTAPQDMQQWMLTTYGTDGLVKFGKAIEHISSVEATAC